MFPLFNTLSFIIIYVRDLNSQIKDLSNGKGLSKTQRIWLGFVLSAIIVSNTICWAVFERMCCNKHGTAKLMGMFRRGKLPWDKLMIASIRMLIRRYDLGDGILLLDDSDKRRSKNVRKIYGVHKVKDKATGGYSMAQNIMFLEFFPSQRNS